MDVQPPPGNRPSGPEGIPSVAVPRRSASVAIAAADGEPGVYRLNLAGDWPAGEPWPDASSLRSALASGAGPVKVLVDASGLRSWSSALVSFLLECRAACVERGVELELASLPEELRGLVAMALAVPAREPDRASGGAPHPIERVGEMALAWRGAVREAVSFVGDCAMSVWAGLRGRAYFRRADLVLLLQQCGADALPIVSLIAFLVGLILAFVGAVQLEQFGATIYVADLVAIAMTREMGCVMVAIVMCGRTGAAFAAQLGTMKVNQEIDALLVFGISPVDFLVLPRLVALFLMIPLLTLYADVVGILGGLAVGRLMLDLSLAEYWNQTVGALTLLHVSAGVIKSFAFGLIVAFTGCLRGLQCGTNAAAVGVATTSAVVIAICGVIAADALFAVAFNILGL